MSTANNRLEIVGFGASSVTFRLIETSRAYNPKSMAGNTDIAGRKSTRSDETDLAKLERIDVYFNDPLSKEAEKCRVLFAKKSGSRPNAGGITEDDNIKFGEFNKKDLNCWTNLSRGAGVGASEPGSLIETHCAKEVIHSYPSIIQTRLASGNTTALTSAPGSTVVAGSELFGTSTSRADSALVKFLQGDDMADGTYELKNLGTGVGTVMFRVGAGEAIPHGVPGVHADNKGELKINTHYHVTRVICTYQNDSETFSSNAPDAPIESAVQVDNKIRLEKAILDAINTQADVVVKAAVTVQLNDVKAVIDNPTEANFKALNFYDDFDYSKNIMFMNTSTIALSDPDTESGLKRTDASSGTPLKIPNQTEISATLSGVPTEVGPLNNTGRLIAKKTGLKLIKKARLLSKGVKLIDADLLADLADPEDRRIGSFYMAGDKVVITPSEDHRRRGDLDIEIFVDIDQDFFQNTAISSTTGSREKLRGAPDTLVSLLDSDFTVSPTKRVVLAAMDGYKPLTELQGSTGSTKDIDPASKVGLILIEANPTVVAGSTVRDNMLRGFSNVFYADSATTTESLNGKTGATLGAAAFAAFDASGSGAVYDPTTPYAAPTGVTAAPTLTPLSPAAGAGDLASAFGAGGEIEIIQTGGANRVEKTIRESLIRKRHALENIPAEWKHSRPLVSLRDRGEVTKTVGTKVVIERPYRRARNSEGFYVSMEREDQATPEEVPTHCLVVFKEQTRNQYESMLGVEDDPSKLNADDLLKPGSGWTIARKGTIPGKTNVNSWYIETEINIESKHHGKSFTILACYGRHDVLASKTVWGVVNELGRVYSGANQNSDPTNQNLKYFKDNVGPQIYIDNDKLEKGVNVSLSNRVSKSGHASRSGMWDRCDVEVNMEIDSVASSGNAGLVKLQIDRLIGMTGTKRPEKAAETADVANHIGLYVLDVRRYVTDVAALGTAKPNDYRDPTASGGAGGLTAATAGTWPVSLANAQSDLTMYQFRAGTSAKADYKVSGNVAFTSGGVASSSPIMDNGAYNAVVGGIDSGNGLYMMNMLFRLRKCVDMIAKNPVIPGIPKPVLHNTNLAAMQNAVAQRFATAQQVQDVVFYIECQDQTLTGAGAGAVDFSTAAESSKGSGKSIDNITLADLADKTLSAKKKDFTSFVTRTIELGDKYLQFSNCVLGIRGRQMNIDARGSALHGGQAESAGSKSGAATAIGCAVAAGANFSEIVFRQDHRRILTDPAGAEGLYSPSLKNPFFRITYELTTNTTAAHNYALMRATEYEDPGRTLSSKGSAVLEVAWNVLNNEDGKISAMTTGSTTPYQDRVAAVLVDDPFKIHNKLSLKVLATQEMGAGAAVTLPTSDQSFVEREYPDKSVVSGTTQNQVTGASGATPAAYQVRALINADFSKSYAQTGGDVNGTATLKVGLEQSVMGSISVSSEPRYGAVPASGGASVVRYMPTALAISKSDVSPAYDNNGDFIDSLKSKNTNTGKEGAEFGAVGYLGDFEVNDRKREFKPWHLNDAELSTVTLTQGDVNGLKNGELYLKVKESPANRVINRDTGTAYVLDEDHDQMFEVKARFREWSEAGAGAWSDFIELKPPNHDKTLGAVTDEYKMLDLQPGKASGNIQKWNGSAWANSTVPHSTLKKNARMQVQLQQFANVASSVNTVLNDLATGPPADEDTLSNALGTDMKIGAPLTVDFVFTDVTELVQGGNTWLADTKNETDADILNSVTTAKSDAFNMLRVEGSDLIALGSDKLPALADSLKNTDGSLADWAMNVYDSLKVDVVVEAVVAEEYNSSDVVTKMRKIQLGISPNLKLKPLLKKDVQNVPAINKHVLFGRSTVPTAMAGGKEQPTAVGSKDTSGNLLSTNIADSWVLFESDGTTKWRQLIMTDLDKTLKGMDLMNTQCILRPHASTHRYTGDDDIRVFTKAKDSLNSLFTVFPKPKLKMDILGGFSVGSKNFAGPEIIDAAPLAATPKARRLQIPVSLVGDGIKQMNIMIAHSDEAEAYFNDLRADGDFVRAFEDTAGNTVASGAGSGTGSAARTGSIQLTAVAVTVADTAKTNVSAANGGTSPADDQDLRTDSINASGVRKDLFYIEKFDNTTGQFASAHAEMQVDSSGNFSTDLTGDYLIHAAMPANGDCSFLLINSVSSNGNSSFTAYSLDKDAKSYKKMHH